MFELVKALEDGAEELRSRVANAISLNAGCELFIAFVTLFPHESEVHKLYSQSAPSHPPVPNANSTTAFQSFSDLRTELVKQGQAYATEALSYRDKIAQLVLGFIKDDSVVSLFYEAV